jgi:hypothetical protein
MRSPGVSAGRETSTAAGGALPFRLTLVALLALLVAVPIGVVTVFDLDGRTPMKIAQDTLRDKYGLAIVDGHGAPLPAGSATLTVSEFSLADGAATEDVPFDLDGRLVLCVIQVLTDDPASVTATCEDAPR